MMTKIKIALINAAELEMSPFVRTYMECLSKIGVDHDLIEWRRDIPIKEKKENVISFVYSAPIKRNPFLKLFDYWKFARFAKAVVKKNKYDKLIVFEYQPALFLKSFLIHKYSKRFIIDVRDYSNMYKYILQLMPDVDKNAYARVLSSPGYKEWTSPVERDAICHNTTIDRLNSAQDIVKTPFGENIVILTNGVLRTFGIDKKVFDAFKGTDVTFRFAGKGNDSELYEKLAEENKNVQYTGYYRREEELLIARDASFINIFLDSNMCYNTAMGNRFYLSIVAGVPMIVNSQNIQAKYALRYKLGVVAETPEEIPYRMKDYINNFNIDEYNEGRRKMIDEIRRDLKDFQNLLFEFTK